MRAASVALLLCLGAVAVSGQPGYNQRPVTGAPTCVAPITQVACFLDAHSGYVFGIRYNYGGHVIAASGGGARTGAGLCNVDLTSMGSVSPEDNMNPDRPAPPSGTTGNNAAGLPVAFTRAGDGMQLQNIDIQPNPATTPTQGIVRVEVYKRGQDTPATQNIPRNRGVIPVIRFFSAPLADASQTINRVSICGNNILNDEGAIKLDYTLTNPRPDHPLFLGKIDAKCSPRTLFPGGNPRGPIFFIKSLIKDCWAPSEQLFPGN